MDLRLFRKRILSIAFWAYFIFIGIVHLIIAVGIMLVTFVFDPDRRLNHLFSCWWGYHYAKIYPGLDVKTLHRSRIQRGRPYVIVANHTSIADIVLCFGLFRQFKWVSKKANFKLPILGPNMRICKYVPLIRGDGRSVSAMFDRCEYWLRRDISIMMFPEGTRSKTGELLPFKPGAFSLARRCGVHVVPVVIHGGHELIAKHSSTFSADALTRIEVLEPIAPTDFESDDHLAQGVRQIIQDRLNEDPFSVKQSSISPELPTTVPQQ